MPSVAGKTSSSKAGIITTSDGDRHIPASTRPDGTVRKEIRVRPGYRPPEDVEVYKNRTAEAWKTRGKGGVPGAELADPANGSTAPAKANKRSRPQKKVDSADETSKAEAISLGKGGALAGKEEESPAVELDPEVVKEKEARKLSKKLRQARDLQQKKLEGGALLPEQFEKVIRINELIRQLDNLGFDAEGQKKT